MGTGSANIDDVHEMMCDSFAVPFRPGDCISLLGIPIQV